MKSLKELEEQQKRLLAVLARVSEELAKYPNVVSVMIGVKHTGGKLTDEGCIKIEVTEKKDEGDLDPADVIPKEIEGVKTDVIIRADDVPQAVCTTDMGHYRPVRGGLAIGNPTVGGSGTLGCVATLTSDNSWVILSNHHVLYGDDGSDGDEVGQPSVGCSWCCKTNVIAINEDSDESLDCAIAKIKSDVGVSNVIEELGNIGGSGTATPVVGARVRKRGLRTGFTSGTISAFNTSNNKVTVDPNPVGGASGVTGDPGGCSGFESGTVLFTYFGDSGSVYVNDNDEIVALHYAGVRGTNQSRGRDIAPILTAMGIAIGTTSAAPGRSAQAAQFAASGEPADLDGAWAEQLEERLSRSAGGRVLRALFATHEREIFHLVNHHRLVMVTWQRKRGPAFLAALARSVRNPRYPIPREIQGVSLQNALMSMAAMLEEHGSDELARDVRRYSADALEFATRYRTARQMLQILDRTDLEAQQPLVRG